jgi:agmatinase
VTDLPACAGSSAGCGLRVRHFKELVVSLAEAGEAGNFATLQQGRYRLPDAMNLLRSANMEFPRACSPGYGGPSMLVLRVPYEEGAYWRKGTKEGPAAIVSALERLRPHSLRTNRALPLPLEHYLAPMLDVGPYDRSAAFEQIESRVSDILGRGCVPVTLGGDHSLTYPVVRSLAAYHGPGSFTLLHLDAHSDTFPATDGYDYHHGAVFRKIVEDGLVAPGDMYQLGLRGFVSPGGMDFASTHGYHLVSAAELRASGCQLDAFGIHSGKPCYVSIDIDAVDPAFAPGTGTPVPGGLTSGELLDLIDQMACLALVGLDLVEVAPIYDSAGITVLLAAHVIMELLVASPFMTAKGARLT